VTLVLWRRRLAGDFSSLETAQERRRDAGATKASNKITGSSGRGTSGAAEVCEEGVLRPRKRPAAEDDRADGSRPLKAAITGIDRS